MLPLEKGEVYLDPSQFRRLIRAQRMTIMDGIALGIGLFLSTLVLAAIGFLITAVFASGALTPFIEAMQRK